MASKTQTATLRLERTMNAPAERIYKAYLDRAKAVRFLAVGGGTVEYNRLDAKVGGVFRYTMSAPGRGSQAYSGKFLELTPHTKIRHTYQFDTEDPAMKTPMEIHLTLTETKGQTKVVFEQFGIPAPIPPKAAAAGWQMGLDALARLVEAEA